MQHVASADGTPIAFTEVGRGTPVVIVGGAFSTATAGAPLAAALAAAGLRGVTMDRRARGDSGDTRPYAPEREAEDLTAVVEAVGAVGGAPAVLGHSSGAVLALFAAARGVPISHLFLSEPPFHFGHDEPSADLPQRMQALIDSGLPEDAVTVFQREGVGLPDALIAQIRASPLFGSLVRVAQSTVYDALLTSAFSTPTAEMTGLELPVTVLRGEPTFPMLVAAAERLAATLPTAELVIVPESHDHALDPAGTTREVAARLAQR